jgi:hypothetical protein
MRKRYYSPKAIERLAELSASDVDFAVVDAQVAGLAKLQNPGYRIPLIIDPPPANRLFRFDIGRFGLIFRYSKDELEVVTVI